jgi:hypothetical protein
MAGLLGGERPAANDVFARAGEHRGGRPTLLRGGWKSRPVASGRDSRISPAVLYLVVMGSIATFLALRRLSRVLVQ